MLTVLECIRQRRSIRSFRSDPVPDEAIHQMLEAARLAPSGSNRQPWRFIVVTEAKEKTRLRQICNDQAFIEQAPVVLVCCVDLTVYSSAATRQRFQEFADQGVMETLSGRITDPAYRAELIAQSPEFETTLAGAMANTYIAIEHMVLIATASGLGTCWVGALGEEREIEKFFRLPDTTVVVAVLPVGYPVKVPPPRPRLSLEKILLRPLSAPGK